MMRFLKVQQSLVEFRKGALYKQTNFSTPMFFLEVDLVRNVIVIGRRRQTKQRNIAVMAMEAEKVEETSKKLEMSVSISQDALEDQDGFLEESTNSPDLISSSPNLYCRQISLQYFLTSNLPDFLQTLIKRSPVGFRVSIFFIKPN